MANPSQDVILLASTTAVASGNGSALNVVEGFVGAIICIQVTAASGTSPTLNVFVQDEILPAASTDLAINKGTGTAIFDDFYAATQITSTATKVLRFSASSFTIGTANANSITTADYAISDAALTAGSVRPGPIGNIWRVKYTIGGTSPSFTFNVSVKLLPLS